MMNSEKVLLTAINAAEKKRAEACEASTRHRGAIAALEAQAATLKTYLEHSESIAAECIKDIAEFEAAIKTIKAADQRRRIYGQEVVR